ncbi:MAG: TlpA family protein disulfide reductase [Planctomycetia bacterium]|nr:TlpA family protein disulfide reductase [Planctomycetia bacterium]
MKSSTCPIAAAIAATLFLVGAARAAGTTVLYADRAVKLDKTFDDGDQLWITPEQLTEISGFVLKPQGVCLDDICIPIGRKPADGFVRTENGQELFNLTKLARKLDQPVVADQERKAWSFGPRSSAAGGDFTSVMAPDFVLPDRQGKLVHLSDFRGKKVFLVTWASWCGCRLDLPGWQTLYEELKDKGLEIIAVAEDTGGEEAAGKFYDRAKATYTTLIDPAHVVSTLYQMVNVPMGVWIDEQGRIVRPAEVAYSKKVSLLSIKVDGDHYVAGLRDWVAKGDQSVYALKDEALRKRLPQRDAKSGLADANFKLAVQLHKQGDETGAEQYWRAAQELEPDNWNYHRQAWAFHPGEANGLWMKKYRELGDREYYAPLDLPEQTP